MVYKIQYKNRCLNLSVSQLLLTNVENVPALLWMEQFSSYINESQRKDIS